MMIWINLLLLLLPFLSRATSIIQVPCLQNFSDFSRTWETDCRAVPCEIVCHDDCQRNFQTSQITGWIYYTYSTPICLAALFEGTIFSERNQGGYFTVRSAGGEIDRFYSAPSRTQHGKSSRASNFSQPAWFIEPYERVRFIKEPQDTTIRLGEQLTLFCEVNTRSAADITWYNNDREVTWSTTVDCKGVVCMVRLTGKAHAGRWHCKVATEHSGTLLSRYARVEVAYLNRTFLYQPRDFKRAYHSDGGGSLQKIDSNSGAWPLVLPCSVDSYPPAQITWMKNGVPFTDRHTFQFKDGSLYFMTVSEDDNGSYRCEAHNTITNETIRSNQMYIDESAEAKTTGQIPSVIVSATTSSTIIARPGETVVVTCVARGNPIPTISWSMPENVRDSPRIETPSFGRNLIIRDVETTDAGEYKCTAENIHDYGVGSTFSSRLLVVGSPTFSIVPADATYNQGDRAVLRCGLRGRGSISWLLNGNQVDLKNGKREMEGNYLIIQDMTVADTGMYQCTGKSIFENSKFVVQASAFLTVRSGPKITVSAKKILRNAGETIRIRCTASGYPYPYVTWFKDEHPLIFNNSIRMVSVQDIVIEEAAGMDIGTYKCVARNSLGMDTLTRNLGLIVKASVKSLVASDPRGYYLVGQDILITCQVVGTQDLKIAWSKDNSEYISADTSEIQEDTVATKGDYEEKRSVLKIRSATMNDQGAYRCFVRNQLGSSRLDLKIRVYAVAVSPTLVVGPINTVVTEEKNMMVTCTFTGAPPPWVTWKINNKPAVESDRVLIIETDDGLTSSLVIKEARRSDSGNYSCEGFNTVGKTKTGVLPISLYYTDTDGLRNGTNSTRGVMAVTLLPCVILLVLLFLEL